MGNGLNRLYEFEEFRFEAETCTLWRGSEIIPLPPKASEVLRLLIESEGKLVTKQEILNKVWADTFVEDGVLTQSIYLLRQTLGADNSGKQFIQTIARRGYRFGVPLRVLDTDEIPAGLGTKANSRGEAGTILSAEYLESEGDESSPKSASALPKQTGFQASEKTVSGSRAAFRNILLTGLALVFSSALGFFAYQFFNRGAEKTTPKNAPIEQLRFQRLTDSGDVIFPTISPNGELLAFVRHEEEGESVWVKQIAADNPLRILPPSRKGYASLTFSPDGKHLYFREDADGSAIYQTTIFGGAPKKVAENVWDGFSISPDGRQFAFVRRVGERNAHLLILVNIDGSGERELAARAGPQDFRGTPAWSPDGARLVVTIGIQAQFFPKLLMIDVSSGAGTELKIPRWRAIPRTLWMPNGKYLIVSAREANEPSSQIWLLSPFDGEVRRLTNDLEGYFWLSLSADGRMLVTRQQRIVSHLWLLPGGDIKKARQLTTGSRSLDGYAGLTWTPDGKIIYSGFADNVTDLYSIDADGGNKVQLTVKAGQDNISPAVSRDGKYIVFTATRDGSTQIWRMDLDGRNQKQLTAGEEKTERNHSPAVSPDGGEVFFIKRGTASDGIWKISIDGGAPVKISRLNNATPEGLLAISPDGKWLAYRHLSKVPETSGDIQTMRIGVIPVDGGAEPKLFDLPMRRPIIKWSPDSQTFDFAAGVFNTSSLVRQPFGAGEPKKIIDFPDRVFDFAWSNDGKNLVVARGRQQGDAILITNLP